jgi:hypothetical protein
VKQQGRGRITDISGANARNAGYLSGGARNASLVHLTKTLAVQMGRHGITVNCIHPGTTRTARTPSLLAARAAQLGLSPEEAERQDFAPDSPRGNAICRMVDASEIAFVAVLLTSTRPGRCPASWSRQPAEPGGRYITRSHSYRAALTATGALRSARCVSPCPVTLGNPVAITDNGSNKQEDGHGSYRRSGSSLRSKSCRPAVG